MELILTFSVSSSEDCSQIFCNRSAFLLFKNNDILIALLLDSLQDDKFKTESFGLFFKQFNNRSQPGARKRKNKRKTIMLKILHKG